MPGELLQKCGTCGYWVQAQEMSHEGWCHYHPPTYHSQFPSTMDTDGCGKGMRAIFAKPKDTND